MARFGDAVRGDPARHLLHQDLLVTILLVLVIRSDTARVPKMTTRADFPYDFYEEKGRPTLTPIPSTTHITTTTQESSSYDYYYEKATDLGSDPSTWKLLPIQIPDDLVSNAVLLEGVVKSSSVPSNPTTPTPQHKQHPGITQPPHTLRPQRLHSLSSDHESVVPDDQNWDQHSTEPGHTPKPQQRWDNHSTENNHSSLESYHQNWDRHDIGSNHSSPEPVQDNWDRHDTGSPSAHNNPAQHQSWDRHSTINSHSNIKPQQQDWSHHSTNNDLRTPNPHHQIWNTRGSESAHSNPHPQQTWHRHTPTTAHVTPAPHHHTPWSRHSTNHNPHHNPPPWQHHYHNRTHTNDGYDIRNYHTDDPQSLTNYHNDLPEHPMPSGPSPWSWKPPNTSSWQQNIVERLTQHLPKLPSLPKLRIPGLSSLPSFPLPNWVFGERVHQTQDQAYPMPTRGDYMHKFYPLIPENDPLEHLNTNINRNHGPLYTYPPLQKHDNHDNALEHIQNTDTYKHQSDHHANIDTDYTHDTYTTPYPTATTQQYNINDYDDHTTKDDPQMNPQKQSYSSYSSHHSSRLPQRTRPDPRLPFHKHQRIRKLPHQHQHHKEHPQQQHSHQNRHNWMYEVQDTPTPAHPPLRDRYSKRPQGTQNWIQDAGIPGRYEDSSTTHEDNVDRSDTYSSHPQEVYEYTPSHGYSQHHHHQQQHQQNQQQHEQHHQHHDHYHQQQHQQQQQHHQQHHHQQQHHHHHQQQQDQHHHQQHQHQQPLRNPWYSESQHQQGISAGFNPDLYDNILEPLSNLLSRPPPLSIINSYPYQQSIIERLTGVDGSSTTSLAIPGGLLVLGLALALFYFNFVWYPTPVVTAKIYKMLSDSVSDGELSEGQQRAVGEVYRVFQGLEAEYKQDHSIWSTPCRTRVVCQVHHELPGLWKVTQAYAALAKSSLAWEAGSDSDLSGYQEAAQRGSEGKDCATLYQDCPLNPVPVKATLRRLLALLQPTH